MDFLALLFAFIVISGSSKAEETSSDVDNIIVETNQALGVVSEKFLSVAIDTKFIFRHNLSKLE